MQLLLITLLGWLIGVLINRAADNLPVDRNVLAAPHCPHCDSPRPVLDQISVLSYLLRRGRCPNCQAPIPFRAPIVEIATAIVFAFLWLRYGATIELVLMATYTAVFLLVLVTDLEHRLIFNVVILPAIVLAALASPFSSAGTPRSLIGGAIAFLIVSGIYLFGKLFERLRGLKIAGGAFGQGDVTLSTFIGLVTAFPGVFHALLFGILLGGIGALVTLAYYAVVQRRLALSAVFAYGPYLCLAGWAVMVFKI